MDTVSNLLVLSYNGLGTHFPGWFKRGWNYFNSGNHLFLAEKLPTIDEAQKFVEGFDFHIDHVVIYAGSLRMKQWAKETMNACSKKWSGCTFTIFVCECVSPSGLRDAQAYFGIERFRIQVCGHIYGNEICASLNMYWSYGVEIYSFPSTEEYYEYYLKNRDG